MDKTCEYENCKRKAYYAYYYGKPERCKEHKEDRKKQYSICMCGKARPSFNKKGEKAIHCFKCKEDGMINVSNKKCQCSKSQPIYNYEGETIGICCFHCKKDDMVDVIHKKCLCGEARPLYNYSRETIGICCASCKKDGMVDIVSKKCECGVQPIFNYAGETQGICCIKCKKESMVDVVNKKCLGQNGLCPQQGNPKYRGYCTFCFSHMFPDDPLTPLIRVKTQEIAVRDFINSKFEEFVHNELLFTGGCDCTHRRSIDHRKLIGNTMLVIETDEFQHRRYNEYDEEIRHDDLYMLYSGKWIFIRYNPDPYKDKNGHKRDPQIKTRFKRLENEINKQIKRIEDEKNNELVEIIRLYYDENNFRISKREG